MICRDILEDQCKNNINSIYSIVTFFLRLKEKYWQCFQVCMLSLERSVKNCLVN